MKKLIKVVVIILAAGLSVFYVGGIITRRIQTAHEITSSPELQKRIQQKLPETSSTQRFSFYVFGDSKGRFVVLNKIASDAKREKPAFMINVGDIVRRGSKQVFEQHYRWASKLTVPYFTVLGNHDISRKTKSADDYYTFFGPTYYSFHYGNSYFVILDNAQGYISSKQFDWLEKVLEKAKHYRHIFVFAHQPITDPRSGLHHCMKPIWSNRSALTTILKKAKIDILFNSHIHSYIEHDIDGIKCIITGGAGAPLKSPVHKYHYVKILVDKDKVYTQLKLIIAKSAKSKR